MNKNIQKIEKAIELIHEARDLVDSVMHGDMEHFQITSNYYTYGEYGIIQLLGEGNPYDGKLEDIIDKLKEENL